MEQNNKGIKHIFKIIKNHFIPNDQKIPIKYNFVLKKIGNLLSVTAILYRNNNDNNNS